MTWPRKPTASAPLTRPCTTSAAWTSWSTTPPPSNRSHDFAELTTGQWDRTFKVGIYSYFWTTKGAYPHLPDGGAVINTASINGLRGNKTLIDYSATKGAILALTYSLAQAFAERGIRVNSVAPGPVWTPLILAAFDEDKVASFGTEVPMGRAAHPDEIAPSYAFFAAGRMSSYYSGEVLAPVGGEQPCPANRTSRRTSMVSELRDGVGPGDRPTAWNGILRGRTHGEIRNRMPRKASQARVAERAARFRSGDRGTAPPAFIAPASNHAMCSL